MIIVIVANELNLHTYHMIMLKSIELLLSPCLKCTPSCQFNTANKAYKSMCMQCLFQEKIIYIYMYYATGDLK